MPQYQGVWTLEQQAQAQSNQQWVTDPNFKNTTLLLQADGTGSGSQNQTFLDGSTNNFFITRYGNTTQGSFSPFSQAPGYWSNYFAAADIGFTASSNFSYTGDFTIEFWFNPQSTSSTDPSYILQVLPAATYFAINIVGNTGFDIFLNAGSATMSVRDLVPRVGVWCHVALVRSGSTVKLYMNGIASATTATNSSTLGSSTAVFYVGAGNTPPAYMSNVRVVKGTAVYTTNFTPPTSPLTAITNTVLLTAQSNRFVDNSPSANVVSLVDGTPSVQAFGPFAPALQWTSDVVGGSGYFDGSGDYLTGPSASGGDFSTGDFTISCWFYPTTLTGGTNYGLMSYADTGGWNGWQLQVRGSTKDILFEFLTGSAGASQITGGSIALNAWNYVAIVRSGSTVSMYVNSTTAATSTTNSTAYGAATSRVIVGSDRTLGSSFIGYISNSKLVKQANAPASIPTAPDTATTNTSLLLNYTNAGIYDGKMANNLETVGNAQVSTSVVKYGSGSMYFDGNGDYLTSASTQSVAFGTGDFTVEMWVYPTTVSTVAYLYDTRTVNSNPGIQWYINTDATMGGGVGLTNVFTTAAGVMTANQWQHIAISKANGVWRIFRNGILLTSGTNTTAITDTGFTLCTAFNQKTADTTNKYAGFIDDFRITKGVARYIANFTPPQQALPRQ